MELVLIDENISGAARILKQAREQRRALASQRRQHQAGKATAAVTGEEKQAVSTQRQAWEGPISHAVVRHAFAGGGDRALAVKVGNMVRVLAATPGSDWWLCRLVDRSKDGERRIDDDGQNRMGWVPAACMQSVGSFPLH